MYIHTHHAPLHKYFNCYVVGFPIGFNAATEQLYFSRVYINSKLMLYARTSDGDIAHSNH